MLSKRSQEKVNAMINEASWLFAKHGFKHVTMEQIAQYANVSKVTLYKYFPRKENIYETIIKQNNDVLYQKTKEIVNLTEPPLFKLQEMLQAEMDLYLNHEIPNLDHSIILSPAFNKNYGQFKNNMKNMRKKVFLEGIETRRIYKTADVENLEEAYLVWLYGLKELYNNVVDPDPTQVQNLIERLIKGTVK